MTQYLGETISLIVAFSWTLTALFAEIASRRLGALTLNFLRMSIALILLGGLLWLTVGAPYPVHADASTWFWLAMSGFVGYVFGDFCLFNSYIVFGARYGQLFMTLAPPLAGITGWLILGEKMSWHSWIAMLVTLSGIALSILARKRDDSHRLTLKLPIKGVLFGIGAGIGQGVGLVLSKIGLSHYEAALPEGVSQTTLSMVPFAGTFIRTIAGLFGFFALLVLRESVSSIGTALKDGKGMKFAVLTTFFGPFLGVSLSLMAVQYAKAGIASTLMALTPVIIILPYALIFHQKISMKEIAGTFITIIGVALFFLL